MTLEGSVCRRFVSHAKQKACRIPYIYEHPVPQEKGDPRDDGLSNWYSNND